MGFNCGIVGLPNVGKSTLFNALTATQAAQAANYPFCTIEPNVGRVAVPDPRLDKLAAIASSAKVINPKLEKRAKGGDKEAAAEAPVVKKALDALREGKPAREAAITADERPVFRLLQLITAKPMMYVLNVEEASAATGNAHSAKAEAYA